MTKLVPAPVSATEEMLNAIREAPWVGNGTEQYAVDYKAALSAIPSTITEGFVVVPKEALGKLVTALEEISALPRTPDDSIYTAIGIADGALAKFQEESSLAPQKGMEKMVESALDTNRIKPPIGAEPFHKMEDTRDVCGLCGMTGIEILAQDRAFCPAILRANKAAADTWLAIISGKTKQNIPALALPAVTKGELHCNDCQQPYAVWFAPSPIWNLVMGGPDAKDDPGGMLCPRCFTLRAEAAGIVPTAWEVRPEQAAHALPEGDEEMVERVGEAILEELNSRRGFRNTLDECDEELTAEIKEALARAAIAAMQPPDSGNVE